MLGARLVNVPSDRRRAHETDGLDVGVCKQVLHRFPVAVDDIENTFGQARFAKEFGDAVGDRRVALGRLQDECVPACDGDRIHPEAHHGGEIEGRDTRDHAQGFPDSGEVDAGGDIGREFPFEELGDSANEFDDFKAPSDFSPGIVHRLAVLERNELGEFRGVFGQKAPESVEDLATPGDGDLGPRQASDARGLHRGIDLAGIGKGDLGNFLARCRVEDVADPGGRGRTGLSVDPMGKHGMRQGDFLSMRGSMSSWGQRLSFALGGCFGQGSENFVHQGGAHKRGFLWVRRGSAGLIGRRSLWLRAGWAMAEWPRLPRTRPREDRKPRRRLPWLEPAGAPFFSGHVCPWETLDSSPSPSGRVLGPKSGFGAATPCPRVLRSSGFCFG